MVIAMDADPTVILMGEDIGVYGGAFQVTLDLVDRYGTAGSWTRQFRARRRRCCRRGPR